jgi:hypothetical protein
MGHSPGIEKFISRIGCDCAGLLSAPHCEVGH